MNAYPGCYLAVEGYMKLYKKHIAYGIGSMRKCTGIKELMKQLEIEHKLKPCLACSNKGITDSKNI